MSKVNLTESILNSLTEQDGGKFQRIANAYLSAKGYKNLTATGSKIGTDKTTQGTPDAYFRTQNGKYILVEYSCQQSGLYAKFKEDIEKCLNTTKTGIPINQIDKIILCHTSILHARNFLSLKKLCEPHQIELEEFGLNCIAMDLEDKYPWIAKKYLGIQIDTGQIVTKEEFISYYEKSRVATSISNQFFSRENELKLFDDSYAENELIIISGPSGVGKTRFALECCERICRQDIDIKNYFVINLNLPIFEDLKKYLYCPENYLIVIDDANRLNQFDHIMNLFLSEVTGRRLKIVVTVRDYALQEVLMLSSHVNQEVV